MNEFVFTTDVYQFTEDNQVRAAIDLYADSVALEFSGQSYPVIVRAVFSRVFELNFFTLDNGKWSPLMHARDELAPDAVGPAPPGGNWRIRMDGPYAGRPLLEGPVSRFTLDAAGIDMEFFYIGLAAWSERPMTPQK